jgi:hypothetical protein
MAQIQDWDGTLLLPMTIHCDFNCTKDYTITKNCSFRLPFCTGVPSGEVQKGIVATSPYNGSISSRLTGKQHSPLTANAVVNIRKLFDLRIWCEVPHS